MKERGPTRSTTDWLADSRDDNDWIGKGHSSCKRNVSNAVAWKYVMCACYRTFEAIDLCSNGSTNLPQFQKYTYYRPYSDMFQKPNEALWKHREAHHLLVCILSIFYTINWQSSEKYRLFPVISQCLCQLCHARAFVVEVRQCLFSRCADFGCTSVLSFIVMWNVFKKRTMPPNEVQLVFVRLKCGDRVCKRYNIFFTTFTFTSGNKSKRYFTALFEEAGSRKWNFKETFGGSV